MSLSLISELEEILEEEGYTELLNACRAIVGSDGSDNGVAKSIDENNMQETMGVSKVHWLRYKIVILENLDIFKEKCEELGLVANDFIEEINKDVIKIEDFLKKDSVVKA
ncbi:MAG: hypothetical protein ACXWVU_05485 [Sulfuricurvum sp.]